MKRYVSLFKEDLPMDLVKTPTAIKVKIDVTGKGDFKDVQDTFKKDMTLGDLVKHLSERESAVQKFFKGKKIEPSSLASKKLEVLVKNGDTVELTITSSSIELHA